MNSNHNTNIKRKQVFFLIIYGVKYKCKENTTEKYGIYYMYIRSGMYVTASDGENIIH